MKFFFLLFLTLSFSLPVMASPEKARAIQNLLEERDSRIKELLGPEGSEYTDQQREEIRGIINEIMDYHRMGKFALADKYHELSSDDQEEFIELFSRIIRDQSLQQLDIYRAEVIYDDIEVDGDNAKVTTTVVMQERRISVSYRMYKSDDAWLISDMSIDDAWTAESYRRSFQNIIRRRGFEALIENLRKRAEQA